MTLDMKIIEAVKKQSQRELNEEYIRSFPGRTPPQLSDGLVRVIVEAYERVKRVDEFDQREKTWPSSPMGQFCKAHPFKGAGLIQMSYFRGEIDGSLETLQKIADGLIEIRLIGPKIREKLKGLLVEE